LYLAFVGFSPVAMRGEQQINVVWLDTPRDTWTDTSEARAALSDALAWWEARVEVSFIVSERRAAIDHDPYAADICHDRSWAPAGRALYMVAWEPTNRVFTCDGVNVADWADPSSALIWGGARPDELAHTIGHFYGALDTHAGMPGGPTGDIMDKDALLAAYRAGYVSDTTLAAIGATRRVDVVPGGHGGRGATDAAARRWQASRAGNIRVENPYSIERRIGGF
jgi:hypothetical protein